MRVFWHLVQIAGPLTLISAQECALGIFTHPFSVQSLTILFGYVLVLRTNIAVSRYMEGPLRAPVTLSVYSTQYLLARPSKNIYVHFGMFSMSGLKISGCCKCMFISNR